MSERLSAEQEEAIHHAVEVDGLVGRSMAIALLAELDAVRRECAELRQWLIDNPSHSEHCDKTPYFADGSEPPEWANQCTCEYEKLVEDKAS